MIMRNGNESMGHYERAVGRAVGVMHSATRFSEGIASINNQRSSGRFKMERLKSVRRHITFGLR